MKIKIGDKVWLFLGSTTPNNNKHLAMGQYIATKDGLRVIRVGKKNVKRKLCEIAKVTGKEKLDFS